MNIIALAEDHGCEVSIENLTQSIGVREGELGDVDLVSASGGGIRGSRSTETLRNFLAHGGSDSGQKWLHIVNNMAANNPGAGPSELNKSGGADGGSMKKACGPYCFPGGYLVR